MVDRILRFLTPTAAALLLLSPMAFAQKRWDAPRVVTWNCSGCHGIDGNAQLPYIPRLAGLNAAYTERRIAEFGTAPSAHVDELLDRVMARAAPKPGASSVQSRVNMNGMAHSITPAEAKASAAWYATQQPARGRSGNPALIQQGQAIFLKGLPADGLLPCQTCHGARAEGKAKVPRLAGQNNTYLLGELAKFKEGDRKHAPEMTMVAKHVESEQFRALASYLQSR